MAQRTPVRKSGEKSRRQPPHIKRSSLQPNVKNIKTKPYKRRKRPIQNEEQKPQLKVIKGGAGKKNVRRLTTLAVIAGIIAAVLFMNSKAPGGLIEWSINHISGMGSGDGFPVKAAHGIKNGLAIRDSDVYLLSETEIYSFNSEGKIIFSRSHGYADPYFSVSRSRVLTVDRGGLKYRVDNKNKLLHEGSLKNSIITGAVGDDGTFALASQSKGYTSEIKVYSKNFAEKFTRSFAKYLVSAVAVSPSGRNIAVSVIGAKDGAYLSVIYVFDITQEKPISEMIYEDDFFYDIEYKESGIIFALSQNKAVTLSDSGKKLEEYSTQGMKTSLNGDNPQKPVVLFTEEGTGLNRVVLFDRFGRNKGHFDIEKKISDISAGDDMISVLCQDGIHFYTYEGKLLGTKETTLYAKNISASGGGVYVSDSEEISFAELKN